MLINKSKAVNKVFRMADRHVSTFQRNVNLHCVEGCGKCCLKKDLNVTVLEFLPAAFSLYHSGEYTTVMNRLEKSDDPICVFYNPFNEHGNCSMYKDRGLLCRLFGFSVKSDKNDNKSLITCNIIKSEIKEGLPGKILSTAPDLSAYYMRMYGIDPRLSVEYKPINKAINEALQLVLFESRFRKKPA